MNPTWITAIIVFIGFIASISAAWAITQYRMHNMEDCQKNDGATQKSLLAAIYDLKIKGIEDRAQLELGMAKLSNELSKTIRTEFTETIYRINSVVFEENGKGRSRYVYREDYEKGNEKQQNGFNRQLDKLEEDINTERLKL